MKSAQTLADYVYRASYNKRPVEGWTDNKKWRDALHRAKRFVLDDEMSVFLSELSTQAFIKNRPPEDNLATPVGSRMSVVRNKLVENLRMGARLPSEVTWVEYNLRKCQTHTRELLGQPVGDPLQMPEREGWLLMRHPHLETAFIAHVIAFDDQADHGDGFQCWTFPVALAWTADTNTVLPWKPIPFGPNSNAPSEISTGVLGYKTDRAGFVFSDMITTPNKPQAMADLLREWSGVQRRMWALLATINDLPVLVTEVKASKGFIGARNYRKFLDFKTVTLTVPQKLYRKTIRDALAIAHRRGGPVRGHWRADYRNPLSPLCDHDFGADEKHMYCNHCKGKKIWITDHVRGDTSRGFVMTDFRVTHPVDNDTTP